MFGAICDTFPLHRLNRKQLTRENSHFFFCLFLFFLVTFFHRLNNNEIFRTFWHNIHHHQIEIVDMHFGTGPDSMNVIDLDPYILDEHLSEIEICSRRSRSVFFLVSRTKRRNHLSFSKFESFFHSFSYIFPFYFSLYLTFTVSDL